MEPMIYFSFCLLLPLSSAPGSKNALWARCPHGSDTWKLPFTVKLTALQASLPDPWLCAVTPCSSRPYCSTCYLLPWKENTKTSHIPLPQFLLFLIFYYFCSFPNSDSWIFSYFTLLTGFTIQKEYCDNSDGEILWLHKALDSSKRCFSFSTSLTQDLNDSGLWIYEIIFKFWKVKSNLTWKVYVL